MALTKVKLIADGVITSANLDASHGITTSDIGEGSNLYYTDSRVSSYLSTNGFATQTDIVAAITDSAPVTLDTLNELAAALGDDPNFATTTATSLGLKAPLASPSFTGNATFAGDVTIGNNASIKSIGSIRIDIDEDNNSTGRAFLVRNDGGTNTLFKIQEDGNVGIGVTSPSTLISNSSVRNAAASGLSTSLKGLNIEVPAGSDSQGYVASFANTQSASANYNAGVLIEVGSTDTTTRLLSVESGGTNRFEVRGDGNVGIGTTSPSTPLQIDNTASVKLTLSGGTTQNGMQFNGVSSDNFYLFAGNYAGYLGFGLWNATDSRMDMWVDGSGNLGLGTTAPSGKLNVEAAGNHLHLRANTATAGKYWNFDITANNQLFIINNGGTGMTIKDDGNVGIGTTSPSKLFSVIGVDGRNSTTYLAEIVNNDNTSDQGHGLLVGGGNNANHHLFQVEANGSAVFAVKGDGNVGIGTTSPDETLHLKLTTGDPRIKLETGGGGDPGIIFQSANNRTGEMFFQDGSTSARFSYDHAAQAFKMYAHNQTVVDFYVSETLAYLPSQSFGIGTTTQAGNGQLTIGISDSDGGRLALTNLRTALFDGDSLGRIEFVSNDSTSTGVKAMIIARTEDTSANTNLQFHTGGGTLTEKMRISSTGRITAPGLDGKTQIHPDVSYRTSDGELFYQTSSIRYKTDIVDLENSLNKVNSLRPVRFTDINTNEPSFGLIAEETNEIIPDVVFTKDEQIEGISYSNLTPFLIKAIQELKAEIETLKTQING